MRELARRAYTTLGFDDYGRIDAILTDRGPFLLEGNTFAGLRGAALPLPERHEDGEVP